MIMEKKSLSKIMVSNTTTVVKWTLFFVPCFRTAFTRPFLLAFMSTPHSVAWLKKGVLLAVIFLLFLLCIQSSICNTYFFTYCTVFENHRKSLFQYCEWSELRLHFEWRKDHLKNAKNAQFREFLKTWRLRSNSATRQVNFNRTKIGGKCQNRKMQMRNFEWFSNNV